MSHYDWRFDYDGGCEDESGHFVSEEPHIYIWETGAHGGDIMEIYEAPIPTVEYPDCDDDHWRLPDDSLTESIIKFLNRREKRKKK